MMNPKEDALYLALRESMVTLQDAIEGDSSDELLSRLAREMMERANTFELAEQ